MIQKPRPSIAPPTIDRCRLSRTHFPDNAQIVPIEVKSGKSGSLKSLLQFIAARECTQAIKFNLSPPSEEEARHQVVTTNGVVPVRFTSHHLPLYFAEELGRPLQEN